MHELLFVKSSGVMIFVIEQAGLFKDWITLRAIDNSISGGPEKFAFLPNSGVPGPKNLVVSTGLFLTAILSRQKCVPLEIMLINFC